MFLFIINVIAILLTIYLAVSYIYFYYVIYCASKNRLVEIEHKISASEYQNFFNVVIYAHNMEQTITTLVNALKNQEYNKEKYVINVILDNCTDETAKVLEINAGARLWRLNSENGVRAGKSEAIRWFFDRIFINDTSDAFVFLNGDSTIRPDFLARLNDKINVSPVISGITLNKNLFSSFVGRTIGYRKVFLNTLIFLGRNIAGFLNYFNDDVLAVKKDVLAQIRSEFTTDFDYQFELPIILSNRGIKSEHSPDVRVFKQYYETTDNILDFFNKINYKKFMVLKNHIKDIISPEYTWASKEYIISWIYPGEFFVIIAILFMMKFAFLDGFVLGWQGIYLLLIYYFILFIYMARIAKFNFQKFTFWSCWLMFSPLALFSNYFINLYDAYLEKKHSKELENQSHENSDFVEVSLTNGDLEIETKIEIINEDALFRVVFWYEDKYMSSRKYLRLSEALKEISDTLMEKGFALKICQNCGYFEFQNNGRADFDRGNCYLKMIKKESKYPELTSVCGCCENIIPEHAKNFVRQELDKLNNDND
ncbi:MAG: glycosyltransferase [Candidatus Gastranaerophilales bacterium]|nr:glycosyltransferase [Candidatus Gastranaerophilales bacterium]